MGVERAAHGKLPTGEAVSIFTLRNGEVEASVTEYGATWVSMVVPSAKGGKADVLLGFDSLDGYLGDHPYFGATVGRFANRIGGAAFSIRGVRHALEANEAPNSLHSGSAGWGRKLWKGEAIAGTDAVEFRYSSPAGEGGFPGGACRAVPSHDALLLALPRAGTGKHPHGEDPRCGRDPLRFLRIEIDRSGHRGDGKRLRPLLRRG